MAKLVTSRASTTPSGGDRQGPSLSEQNLPGAPASVRIAQRQCLPRGRLLNPCPCATMIDGGMYGIEQQERPEEGLSWSTEAREPLWHSVAANHSCGAQELQRRSARRRSRLKLAIIGRTEASCHVTQRDHASTARCRIHKISPNGIIIMVNMQICPASNTVLPEGIDQPSRLRVRSKQKTVFDLRA